VIAEHDVTIKSCESADVSAGGALRFKKPSTAGLSGADVFVPGRLRGGSALAERSVVVKEAGTPSGTMTLLQAGEPLEPPDLGEVQRAVVMQKLRRMAERGGVRDAFGSRATGVPRAASWGA